MASSRWTEADTSLPDERAASATELSQEAARQGSSTTAKYFESVVSMLNILSCPDQTNAHRALLAITNSPESCLALRKAGCVPLLIQILHPVNLASNEQPSLETKARASRALKNIVHFNPDEKQKRKEMRVLKLLESIRTFSEQLRNHADCTHPVQSTTTLMKLSFDEEHRLTMCHLGAIHALADLIQADHSVHGNSLNSDCIITRRYSGMTLTNLTFGDGINKALLCSMQNFLTALVAQLDCQNEDVCQVTASVLRNLSWHADSSSRNALRDSNVVAKLTTAAIKSSKESTLKATLSALWNLSAHSAANKAAICRTDQAIDFLIGLLNYKAKTLTIVENAGGILRNIATIIATDEITRQSFRGNRLIEILLEQLKSSSLTVVSNACGTLWHLSGNCPEDQKKLMELGALPKLKALMYSKHERIAQGASAAFKNLLAYSNSISSNKNLDNPSEPSDEQQPIDLRRNTDIPSTLQIQDPLQEKRVLQDEPLDLSMHSSKSSPIHVVSASEFGVRSKTTPVFLNPPTQQNISIRKYNSPKNYNSCPELMRFIQPAHQTKPLDCSKSETLIIEDTTTNYSLHFTESEDSPNVKHEDADTIKTYYCEGTPLNFSTSNSMTDLSQVEKQPKLKPIQETEAGDDQPKKYCTEHTPANFSRASSLSSIASNIQGGENKAEYVEEQVPKQVPNNIAPVKEKVKRNVTFSANETPLMFSRSSSVNSLDSIEMNYEDGGSVLSEFSRRTSEAVSPSDLPDSPRQLVVVDRYQEKEKAETKEPEDTLKVFNSGESAPVTGLTSARSLSPLTEDGEPLGVGIKMEIPTPIKTAMPVSPSKPTPILKQPRHEIMDEMRIFAIEGTPFGVSNSTSLSDLVCEFDKETESFSKKPDETEEQSENVQKPTEPPPAIALNDHEEEPIYSDAQVLLKCINAGKASRIPKSKSEFSNLNEVKEPEPVKTSTSYHENLKSEAIDPDLAALILKGKNKARNSSKRPTHRKINQQIHQTNFSQNKQVSPTDPSTSKYLQTMNKPTEDKKPAIEEAKSVTPDPAKIAEIQQSVISLTSEWNDETPTLSTTIPSMSISAAFKLVEEKAKAESPKLNTAVAESTISNVQQPSAFSPLISSIDCKRKTYTKSDTSNLLNQKPPPELDLENSMISVASLQSEVASSVSIGAVEAAMTELSIGVDTYTVDGSFDGTDIEDSLNDETESHDEVKKGMPTNYNTNDVDANTPTSDRFLTFTKSHSSPKQKRHDDPTRYLTRTITPVDGNGNTSIPTTPTNQFATFKVEKPARVLKPIASTSNESSPSASPKGIRGRRKPLYSSLPPQRKVAPPVPPKPRLPVSNNSPVYVRPTRSSELRAALSSRDSSPRQSKQSSKNSSTTSLNTPQAPLPVRKVPPKPPVRTSVPSKNFAVVRAVRNSNSSIGFTNNLTRAEPSAYNTLPRSSKLTDNTNASKEKESKVGRLSNFWNQLTKSKADNINNVKPVSLNSNSRNGNNLETSEDAKNTEKKTRFGIGFFGKKKKEVWVKRENEPGKEKIQREKAFVHPFNYNNQDTGSAGSNSNHGAATGNSKMTTV